MLKRGEQVVAQRPARFGAEPADAARRVVAGERRQVDAGHRLHEPGRLIGLLHRAPRDKRRRAPLDRARVDADALEPGGIERRSRIAGTIVADQGGLRGGGVHGRDLATVPTLS